MRKVLMLLVICLLVITTWAIAEKRIIQPPERRTLQVSSYDFSLQPIVVMVPGSAGYWVSPEAGHKIRLGEKVKVKYQVTSKNQFPVDRVKVCLYVNNVQDGCDDRTLAAGENLIREVEVPRISAARGDRVIKVKLDLGSPRNKFMKRADHFYTTEFTVHVE